MLTLLALSVLMACGQPSSNPASGGVVTQTVVQEEGTLTPGGSFTASNGVTIRAPAGVLTAPVQVFAHTLAPNSVTLPLPTGWTRVGDFFSVGATVESGSKNRESFQIELPVPTGVSSRGLSVAVLIPPKYLLSQEGEIVQPFWDSTLTTGASGLTTLISDSRVLSAQGFTYVVVRQSNAVIPASDAGRIAPQATPVFTAVCEGSVNDFPCLDSVKTASVTAVTTAYSDFVSAMSLNGADAPIIKSQIRLTLVGTRNCPLTPQVVASYHPVELIIRLCVNSNGEPRIPAYLSSLRHEIFHAVQAGILASVGVQFDGLWSHFGRSWIIEATANVASVSLNQTNVRSDVNSNLARRIASSLLEESGTPPYQAQDYWAYVGRRLNQGIIYIKTILQNGLANPTGGVDSVLAGLGYNGGLTQSHWDWIKNQTVERSIDVRNIGNQCKMDLATVGTEYTDNPINFDFGASPILPVTRVANAEALGGRAVKIKFANATGGVVRIRITPTGSVRYKVYKVKAGQPADCATLPDGAPRGDIVSSISAGTEVIVVAENPSLTTANDFTINIEPVKYWMVLTWGANPADLDSHLTGPTGSGSRFHTFYGSPFYSDTTVTANLDVDDVTSYGPETSTVYSSSIAGTYRYSVHDYTNRDSVNSSALGASGARVKVYSGSNSILINDFSVPGSAGTLWTVFEIQNDVVAPINAMSYTANPASVQRVGSSNTDKELMNNLPPKR